MTREILHPKDEAQWLEFRLPDITSTAMPALFGLSPYLTDFEMYHAKKTGLEIPFEVNDRMLKGSRMQDYAAHEIALAEGWTVRRMDEYIRIPNENIGSSFDYEVICPERGAGILEIKAVDYGQFKDKWNDEAPPHIEIQLQTQLEVADTYNWGVIGVFTSLYDHHLFFRHRDVSTGLALRAMAKKFWQNVRDGIEPKPDFYRDSEVIAALFRKVKPEALNLSEDGKMNALASKYLRLDKEEKLVTTEKQATKSEIHYRLGVSGEAFTKRYRINATWTADSEKKKGYRRCKINDLMEKKGTN